MSTFVLPEHPTPEQFEIIGWAAGLWSRLHREQQTEQKWRDLVTCTRDLLASANPQK